MIIVAGLAALFAAAASDGRARVFSVGIPNVGPIALLSRHDTGCEGPIRTGASFDALELWAETSKGQGSLAVTVRTPSSHRALATGLVSSDPTGGPFSTNLSHTVPAGSSIAICFSNPSAVPSELLGSGAPGPAQQLIVGGKPTGLSPSLVMLQRPPRSYLSMVSTVFTRAALFRPGWVGVWTYWALATALLVAIILCGFAVRAAIREEDDQRSRHRPVDD